MLHTGYPLLCRIVKRALVFYQERLRQTQFAVDHAADAVYWMGDDGRFIYVNEAACRTLGYTREEFLTMTVPDIDPDFPQFFSDTKPRFWSSKQARWYFRRQYYG